MGLQEARIVLRHCVHHQPTVVRGLVHMLVVAGVDVGEIRVTLHGCAGR